MFQMDECLTFIDGKKNANIYEDLINSDREKYYACFCQFEIGFRCTIMTKIGF